MRVRACHLCGRLSFQHRACDFCSVPLKSWTGLWEGIFTPSMPQLTVGCELSVVTHGPCSARVLRIEQVQTGIAVRGGHASQHAMGIMCVEVCARHGEVRPSAVVEYMSLDMAAVLARTRQRVVLSTATRVLLVTQLAVAMRREEL
jgi:hypothetical protein